ncbi:hypothetical protein ACTWQL_17335 [Pseudalkalibacillus sp. R45]|uniref:hypothetical protein n=1 Tax=Pseudalkalibacillus sp. R45 TaxID=3457433 RepID=UPI003FCD9331
MPCEEIIHVVGTLIPQESRTLLSNQLAQGEFLKITQKQQSFRKESLKFIPLIYCKNDGQFFCIKLQW